MSTVIQASTGPSRAGPRAWKERLTGTTSVLLPQYRCTCPAGSGTGWGGAHRGSCEPRCANQRSLSEVSTPHPHFALVAHDIEQAKGGVPMPFK